MRNVYREIFDCRSKVSRLQKFTKKYLIAETKFQDYKSLQRNISFQNWPWIISDR